MPTYQFEAMDAKGQEIRDIVEAENEDEAQTYIRDMGYFVTKIHVKKGRKSAAKKGADGKKRGFAIGIDGWEYGFLESWFGPLETRQFGMGYGALLVAASFLFLLAQGLAARGAVNGDSFVVGSIGLIVAVVNPMPDLPRAPGAVCLGGLVGERASAEQEHDRQHGEWDILHGVPRDGTEFFSC